MSSGRHHEVWSAIRRIGEIRGRIAALDDIRLRLIEMGELACADDTAAQIDRLRKGLDYHQHLLVALQARLARASAQSLGPSATRTWQGPAFPATSLRRALARRSPDTTRDSEDAA